MIRAALTITILLAACGKTASNKHSPAPQAVPVGSSTAVTTSTTTSTATSTGTSANVGLKKAMVFGALGDSITRGFNATQLFDEDTAVVWSVGDGVDDTQGSHYARFKKELGVTKIDVVNGAVSGATSEGLDDQLREVVPAKPDYVSLLMGANDLCTWPTDHAAELAAYEERMEDAVNRLVAANPAVRIVLSGVPDINQVYELKKANSNCRAIWKLANMCTDLLGEAATDATRAAFHERWKDLHKSLAALAARHAANVHYVDKIATATFKVEDISTIDCFHPSPSGHKLLSDLTWDAAFARQALQP